MLLRVFDSHSDRADHALVKGARDIIIKEMVLGFRYHDIWYSVLAKRRLNEARHLVAWVDEMLEPRKELS